ncbi:bifunctional diaminohydroxyphosphoribosylaminopyrimidine deaminase/5-amino-6-(5-phosphoribosylamino)uracil reductase RibD [Parvularcula sp. IMCC14364]|uniref:bifunctional diaminohydroxyphosphoribosylaminopyrimidine deaminase/5-amino-6-(5-phosphoribosylamino)uracil reductase RibD n=1 Tax=Parvularcula sp. IMCC14364 TaxID=3067902 RepID=UPI002740570F|nr:bifunctional diaminohydroxyphosphoribosylaminopyrimidine deaminase/5-amino-6-(5-phosphoribosylamino)uracil reductase RibD [Parvularcula sp. IMCC14364]
MGDDTRYMMRAIDLAKRAEGYTSPNPMVGCVLVREGRIVGEGFHARPGTAHAEANALRSAGDEARGATAYVTLEPCNHHGSNPPCSTGLIKAGIAEVVYAVPDPNPVAAGGADALRAAGITVRTGLCTDEARHLIRFWLHHIQQGSPYVIAKFAASLDGKIATRGGESQWITSDAARLRGHDLRQACDAIIVGVDTVIADNPSLTARPNLPAGHRDAAHPLRVILDSSGRVPIESKVFRSTTPGKTLLATTAAMPALKEQALRARGVDVVRLPASATGRPELEALLEALHTRGVLSCMVEGGGKTLGSFFDAQLVNEVWAFIAPLVIGGNAPGPVSGVGIEFLRDAFRLQNTEIENLEATMLMRGQVVAKSMEASCSQAS